MSEKYIILEKIKKLLRLGKRSTHTGEATNALLKAQELAQKHGLKIDEINDADVTQRIVQERGTTRRASFERQLVWMILFEHFGVEVLFCSWAGNVYVGPEINIAIARHIEVFLLRECSRALKAHQDTHYSGRRPPLAKKRREGFVIGFFHEIHEKLKANPLRNDRENEALKEAITHYVKSIIKPLERKTEGEKEIDAQSWHAGSGAGEKVNLSRPMEGAAQRAAVEGGAMKLVLW